MNVGTVCRWRPVCPPGSISIVWPLSTTGTLTTSRNAPSDVMSGPLFTPLACGTAGAWADAGPTSPTTAIPATMTAAMPVALMTHLLEWTARSPPLLDCRSRNARDELVEEQVVDDGHRHADQQRAGHQRAPEIDVTADQLGGHAERDGLLVGDRHEGQRVEEVLHRQREGEDDGGDDAGPAHRQHHAQQRAELAAAVHHGRLLDLERHRLEEAHQQPRAERDREGRVDDHQRPPGVLKIERAHHASQ